MWWYELPALTAATFVFPWEYAKRLPARRRQWARERWAIDLPEPHDVWIHAVSVGECLSAVPVVRVLESRVPGIRIALSTVTDTGYDIASQRLPGHRIFYMPWDMPFLLRRTLRALRPRVLVIMETEIWPGLLGTAQAEGVPALLLNGRISDRSFRRYMKAAFFMGGVLRRFSAIGLQSEIDRQRIVAMGAPEEKALCMGNIKYDLPRPPEEGLEWMNGVRRPLFVAGSTHEGEEKGLLEVYRSLLAGGEDLQLVIVPRHPERFDEVDKMIVEAGFRCVRRSRIGESDVPGPDAPSVILVDRMGELAGILSRSDIVFLGGSLVPVGGHNILEAALWSKPVLVGPHMWNFREMTEEFLEAGALMRVHSFQELENGVRTLLRNEDERRETGNRAYQILEKNRGASERCADLIGKYLHAPACTR